ncbi:MAG TPA: CPBP family intramembrane metalloprotease [Leucothrix mucor]|uniref:CPBP family intramembrane metalloprotease n=1 Tax=Leucothrix mucor TaxID=45248 RepID=A0A7V2T1R4_LEUMU|nr:CPBP family intramembrane metalloprotease [Leucothrix mucor]
MTSNEPKSTTEYWRLGATIVFSLLILLSFIISQTIAFTLYARNKFADYPSTDEVAYFNSLLSNGDAISMAEIPAAIIGIMMTFVFILLHKHQSIENYLHLHPIDSKTLLKYAGIMMITIFMLDMVTTLVDHPTPQIMQDIYHSAKQPVLLWFALIIAAPFFEEILFRGFLFEGLRHSSLGFIGSAILTSALWAGIHLQYGLYEIVIIFFVGLILAYAKAKTGSLYIPITMHSLMNFSAVVEIELNLG